MDQQQHMTKTEAHPYHKGPQAIQMGDGRAYDPQCPICRECSLPPRALRPGTGLVPERGDYGGAFDGFQVTSDADPGL